MNKYVQKIKKLNSAYKSFGLALNIIETSIKKTNDIDTHLWRIKKSFQELQKDIFKQLENENINDEFGKIIKKYKSL
jgi:hypothetical protein